MKLRKLIESVLALPATALYGLPAVLGVPLTAVAIPVAVVGAPDLALIYFSLFFLLLSALLGLTALWVSIFGGFRRRPRLIAAGLVLGIVGAGGFVLMTFSNDEFDVATTWTYNAPILWPLLLVLPVGVSRLMATLRPSG